jgi:hypothetical protein
VAHTLELRRTIDEGEEDEAESRIESMRRKGKEEDESTRIEYTSP